VQTIDRHLTCMGCCWLQPAAIKKSSKFWLEPHHQHWYHHHYHVQSNLIAIFQVNLDQLIHLRSSSPPVQEDNLWEQLVQIFLQARCSSRQRTNSVKAPMETLFNLCKKNDWQYNGKQVKPTLSSAQIAATATVIVIMWTTHTQTLFLTAFLVWSYFRFG